MLKQRKPKWLSQQFFYSREGKNACSMYFINYKYIDMFPILFIVHKFWFILISIRLNNLNEIIFTFSYSENCFGLSPAFWSSLMHTMRSPKRLSLFEMRSISVSHYFPHSLSDSLTDSLTLPLGCDVTSSGSQSMLTILQVHFTSPFPSFNHWLTDWLTNVSLRMSHLRQVGYRI